MHLPLTSTAIDILSHAAVHGRVRYGRFSIEQNGEQRFDIFYHEVASILGTVRMENSLEAALTQLSHFVGCESGL